MKVGTTELLKFQRLQRRLKESIRGTVGLLELLWQRVAQYRVDGREERACHG